MEEVNALQAEYWTSPAGRAWVEHERGLDAAMQGILDALIDAAALREGERVLDVGCGTGASTLAAARGVPGGTALGVDIAAPMLARAAQRAREAGLGNIAFRLCDAQVEHLAPCHDVLISRFGMSFFADPVAAFRNLHASMCTGGRMVFVSWAGLEDNPWFAIPEEAAARRLGETPAAASRAPGPLAFAEPGYVLEAMRAAGWRDPRARTLDLELTPPDGPAGLAHLATRVGPAARLLRLRGSATADRAAVERDIEAAFRAFSRGRAVRVPARIHVFQADHQEVRDGPDA